jgi:hypothetical protein
VAKTVAPFSNAFFQLLRSAAAIDAAPGKPVLTKYNRLLAKPDLGVELLRLIRASHHWW